MAYDPMTLLTFEDMGRLVDWWRDTREPSVELPNQTCSGGTIVASVDECGVWITPEP